MTTIDRLVPTVAGEVRFSLGVHHLLHASIVRSAPRFRIFRGLLIVARLQHLKHPQLSSILRCHWHILRAHSSYSRA